MATLQLQPHNSRATKLVTYFRAVVSGRTALQNLKDGTLFIEAVCAQTDPSTTLFEIASSSAGLVSLQASLRFSQSSDFLNGSAVTLLRYLQALPLRNLCGGDLLRQTLQSIVKPPIFWEALVQMFRDGGLQEAATQAFSWLLAELLSLPNEQSSDYLELANDITAREVLLEYPHLETRIMGQKIKHILATSNLGGPIDDEPGPGGRHDNDFVDFRQISILPTPDELNSIEEPFLLTADALEDPARSTFILTAHLDNQFRLLREDMLADLREELLVIRKMKKGNHKGIAIDNLVPNGMDCGSSSRRQVWGMEFRCESGIPRLFNNKLAKGKPEKRISHLQNNRNLFRHQSLACVLIDGDVAAFPYVNRDEELLAQKPPVVVLQFTGATSTAKVLLRLKFAKRISLVQIDTAVFSYAPVLKRLQHAKELPLLQSLLSSGTPHAMPDQPARLVKIIRDIKTNPSADLKALLNMTSSVQLDASQVASLLSGLSQSISLIQGPPGTGKSFIGALIAKILHDSTSHTILVVCYTNHALDQFLEELLGIGIPPEHLVRLGGKSTVRTQALAIREQLATFQRSKAHWKAIDAQKSRVDLLEERLRNAFATYQSSTTQKNDVMEYLEFSEEGSIFHDAFTVPKDVDGMERVGKKGKLLNEFYLFDRWSQGDDAGIFAHEAVASSRQIWSMDCPARVQKLARWRAEVLHERVSELNRHIQLYNEAASTLGGLLRDRGPQIIRSKRIVGCTTTGAAIYVTELQAASPDVVLVEEAGEILESHVLTALSGHTKQLILIGDHKQLRPKVQNYRLTVEKGEGYNLNQSLFERLVLKGFPHNTLTRQHRMRPEISSFVRQMTYPELVDAPKTLNRPDLRGFRDNVMFINHAFPEDDLPKVMEKSGTGSSKQNSFEASMVLKCVRYLAQQGYGSDKIVILTPYLGQLQLLHDLLSKDNDPVLNDLDSHDLVRAGLLSSEAARLSNRPLRLATIDNYQGEESEIVIVTFTRGNAAHDIGFMAAPERLNVLLSRARNALIMIGNAETFLKARKGGELWARFFELLRDGQNIYDGFPVRCERHPDRTTDLKRATDFDDECPDGGCKEPCGTMLSCGLHPCPQRCHQLYDHTKMRCKHLLHAPCPKGHPQSWRCNRQAPLSCKTCDAEAEAVRRQQEKVFEEQQKLEAERLEHARQMALVQEQIDTVIKAQREGQLSMERHDALEQRKADLGAALTRFSEAQARSLASRLTSTTAGGTVPVESTRVSTKLPADSSNKGSSEAVDRAAATKRAQLGDSAPVLIVQKSSSEEEWQRQKDVEGASNEALDQIMEMIGLEEVKTQMLRIKSRIDTTIRQGTNVKDERFNIALLGNPGTGKTTVARLYARFLTLVGVLPGTAFVETTGACLANGGVSMVTKHLEEIRKADGGTLFVDEAYQLTSAHNLGGGQVLDFLLAEMENNLGKIVFIIAGYNLEMESFFKHNPGLHRRIPYRLQFADYEDHELQQMLVRMIHKKYGGKMKIESGTGGLYVRIAIRRLGRGRGREGFGNAGALQNMVSKISERQADRLNNERRDGRKPDDFLLLKEDLIGPDPSRAIVTSKAWEKLQGLIGLAAVKEAVLALIGLMETNYQRELKEKGPIEYSLNRVFLGPPGTGKTSVAKLYGQILADLGMLSSGEVVTKNPADFIGSVLGQSESNTKGILAAAVGKVLIIDEAYMLCTGSGSTGNESDSFRTAVVDTIVAEVQSVPGEDRCVLLLGYEEQITEMFRMVNPGLSRRFPIANAFHFHDFADSELREILDLKLRDQGLDATDGAKAVASDVLRRARTRPNFGNAGEVENLLGVAKASFQSRQSQKPSAERSFDVLFEAEDFDPDFNRSDSAAKNIQKLFEDVIGSEEIVNRLGGYQQIFAAMKARGLDPLEQIPTNFIFRGPPGTGKTTTARKIGQVFYDMGFLSAVEVIECSASDLIGQYLGHTGPKTRSMFEKALGRVLLVDEAYRLGEGKFASEAIDEIVDILTKPKFCGKVIVILAGYDNDMKQLLTCNTGLASRFSEEITFRDMMPEHCLQLLVRMLEQKAISVPAFLAPNSSASMEMRELFGELSRLPFWGNARDVQTLAKNMIGSVFKSMSDNTGMSSQLDLSAGDALQCARTMLDERRERGNLSQPRNHPSPTELQSQCAQMSEVTPPPTLLSTQTERSDTNSTKATAGTREEPQAEPSSPGPDKISADQRDPDVSDPTWAQLQADKQAACAAMNHAQAQMLEHQRNYEQAEQRARVKTAYLQTLAATEDAAKARAENDSRIATLKRLRERARLEDLAACRVREEAQEKWEMAKKEQERRRMQEVKAQTKLRSMGLCSAGYVWIKQAGGWRCAGGSHSVSNELLGL